MNNTIDNEQTTAETEADVMLSKLLALKQYECPEEHRMVRNKQNIMRQVRQSQSEQRGSILDRLEFSVPWFFANPKYGIAALFMAFIGLQFLGINARQSRNTGIYSPSSPMASFDHPQNIKSNQYPNLPTGYNLFETPEGDQSVLPAAFEFKE